jgi:TonB family protein
MLIIEIAAGIVLACLVLTFWPIILIGAAVLVLAAVIGLVAVNNHESATLPPSEPSGVGSGTGSEGMLQDPDFVLYYQAVQDKIKKAWSFMGGSSDLTATVDFSIGPDGALTGVKLAAGSKDSAFDESVIRAIRRAARFPAPPDKYRSEFMQGIEAQFALGDLRGSETRRTD